MSSETIAAWIAVACLVALIAAYALELAVWKPRQRKADREEITRFYADALRLHQLPSRPPPAAPEPLWCWECKSCAHEHWSLDPPAGLCPGCRQEYRTWIGHRTGARSSCSMGAKSFLRCEKGPDGA